MSLTWRGVAGGVLAVVVAAVCVRLGLWQLDRLEQRRAANAAYAEAAARTPVQLAGPVLDSIRAEPESFLFRPATVAAPVVRLVVWRGRSRDGRPGVHILSLREVADGGTMVVDEGWAPSADASRPPAVALRADPLAAGVLVPLPDREDAPPPIALVVDGDSVPSIAVPDPAVVEALTGRPPLPLMLRRTSRSQRPGTGPDAPIPAPPPDLTDEGPHLSYAVQWFSFAVIALVGFAVVVRLRTRRIA